MPTTENVKKMTKLARKWGELWEGICEIDEPERNYLLMRIREDLTHLRDGDAE